MGPLLAQLTRMGLQNIGFELITDVRSFRQNERAKHELSAEAALGEYVNEHPTFQINDAVKHFEAKGRTAGAIYTAARVLIEKGALKKLSPGNYARADVKALAAPKSDKTATDAPKRFEITGADAIWRFVKNRKSFTTKQLRALFKEQGRNEASVSPILNDMLNEKRIKHTGEPMSGEYLVLKKATKAKPSAKKPPAKKAAPHLNGSSSAPAEVTTEAAHG
jgi:hypothetical protein